MYKIFLVEDEIVVREGIKNNIDWENEGCVIVGDESDGELAYPAILRAQPDILITDIMMPFMDGLELSKLLKKEMPQLKIIIISGYSDFAYAQKAIDIGITEYILKPVTSSKLITAVKNAAEVIEKERKDQQIFEEYQYLIYEKQGEMRRDFFEALVTGKLSFSQIIEQEEELGIHMVAGFFRVMLFQFKVHDDMFEYSNDIVECEDSMQEALLNLPRVKVFERGMEGWAFILLSESEVLMDALTQEVSELLEKISYGKVLYFGGIGRIVNRTRDIQQSFADANKAFSLRYFERGNQFFTRKDVHIMNGQMGNHVLVSELNLEKLDRNLIDEFLKRGSSQDVDEFVDRYFNGLDSNAMNSILFRQYIMMDGYSAIIKFLTDLNYTKDKIDASLKNLDDITQQLNSLEACIKLYKSLLKEAIDLRNMKSQKKYSELIQKAKEFIQLNYGLSDMTLNKVAAEVNISPNYFSALFNQETSITFIDYLTEIRMDKAKEYLRCSNKKITEIGYLVGYLDSHYFSYIFKKTQNCTPTEYRMEGIGDE